MGNFIKTQSSFANGEIAPDFYTNDNLNGLSKLLNMHRCVQIQTASIRTHLPHASVCAAGNLGERISSFLIGMKRRSVCVVVGRSV